MSAGKNAANAVKAAGTKSGQEATRKAGTSLYEAAISSALVQSITGGRSKGSDAEEPKWRPGDESS